MTCVCEIDPPSRPRYDRESMLRVLEEEFRRTAFLTGFPEPSAAVRRAMARVPREQFVPSAHACRAYDDTALPIGSGQTISQPFIVALMTELLAPGPDSVILEVGTGSGYQAAVLAEIARRVYSVEIVGRLALEAARRLRRLGYRNVRVRHSDGREGWPERAPFDGIIVTAVAPSVPQPLIDQLACGGRLVIPLGAAFDQQLTVVSKAAGGEVREHRVLPVVFVPLTKDDAGRR
jgi:protein-L-isoaspartate(D-aspartate) O-methyltransferase